MKLLLEIDLGAGGLVTMGEIAQALTNAGIRIGIHYKPDETAFDSRGQHGYLHDHTGRYPGQHIGKWEIAEAE